MLKSVIWSSLHFSGVYELNEPTHRIAKRIKQLEHKAQENFSTPNVALVWHSTDEIYSSKSTEADYTAVVLTGLDSRAFCKTLGLEFPKFTPTDRHQWEFWSAKALSIRNQKTWATIESPSCNTSTLVTAKRPILLGLTP